MSYVVGIDVGGTCTDCVVIDDAGRTALGKAFSTPPDFFDGVLGAVEMAAVGFGTTAPALLARTRLFLHSTTVAENAIVDGNLAPAGLITTHGFEDTLFATRGGYGRWSGLTEDEKRNPVDSDKPRPLIPIGRIRGLRERTDARGAILAPVSLAEVDAALDSLVAAGVTAVGICILWSFVEPKNEQTVLARVRERRPDLFVTASHDIAPLIGEYERTSTVALNACLGPVVGRYLARLEAWLAGQGFRGALLVMQAHGGLVPVRAATARPVGMLESGPVGGLIGSLRLGELLDERDIISADLGGTTFKVGTVQDGRLEYQRESMVFRYHYALPKMDVVSLGLAGGSIVSVDPRTGQPRLGPRSAGSYPGPVCYDHGGAEPTLTDVDAILGYLNEAFFLDGTARLDLAAARAAFARHVAEPLGMDLAPAAAAIHRLANSRIYDLIHKTTVQRGLDPRTFVLFSTGGTGGMHLPAVGAMLGVRAIVVPYSASVHGAFGLATSDVVHEELATQPMRVPADPGAVSALLERLTERVRAQLEAEGFARERIRVVRAIDMRYRRQVHVLTVPLDESEDGQAPPPVTAATLDDATERFETLYKQRYGAESTFRAAGIEMVTFRVRVMGGVPRPALRPAALGEPDAGGAVIDVRRAYVDDGGWREAVPGYDFNRLRPGHVISGPAIVWTPITTVIVQARQVAAIDGYRNLVIRSAERR